jgi:hypothetical protein
MRKTPFNNPAADGAVGRIVVSKEAVSELAKTSAKDTSCDALSACCRGCSRRGAIQNQALSIRSRWRCVCS